jgi:hypothetical protein
MRIKGQRRGKQLFLHEFKLGIFPMKMPKARTLSVARATEHLVGGVTDGKGAVSA